ncbi:MAG: hypothetical protein D6722_28690 [Bacteroidetes bacterium]|nr:MAG: hypothetical protein D6722_28690 [Bacteroidota bacterium]
MDLSAFFSPITVPIPPDPVADSWAAGVPRYESSFPDWQIADLVLIGCREARGGAESGLEESAAAIRAQLYRFSLPQARARIVDLGDLRERDDREAYYEAMAYVLHTLFEAGKTVILLGGSQDLTFGAYLAAEGLQQHLEYVHIDSRFDLEASERPQSEHSFNRRIFLHEPGYLFNYTNLGFQRYMVSEGQRQMLGDFHYPAIRYGELAGQIEEAEPHLREAHLVSFDLAAVRLAEAPAAYGATPGGFTSEEACRLARYAGLGYQLKAFWLGGFRPALDPRHQTSMLAAMIAWYVVDGYYSRRDDYPRVDRSNLRKYAVRLHAPVEAIDFFRHTGSDRWWMEVPYPHSLGQPQRPGLLVPCSERDYEFARTDDIPERWWLTFHKLKG